MKTYTLTELAKQIQEYKGVPKGMQFLLQTHNNIYLDSISLITRVHTPASKDFNRFIELFIGDLNVKLNLNLKEYTPKELRRVLSNFVDLDVRILILYENELFQLGDDLEYLSDLEINPDKYTVAFTFTSLNGKPTTYSFPADMFSTREAFHTVLHSCQSEYEKENPNYSLRVIFTNWSEIGKQYEYHTSSRTLEEL